MQKLRLPGTHRQSTPAETWQRIAPLTDRFGITRIADVTGLDQIGIPVMLAVRPGSRTLAVAQGKGPTKLLAKLSAVMESIELRHAEDPELEHFGALPNKLDLPYRMADLNVRDSRIPLDELVLEWVTGRGLIDGQCIPVPYDTVRLSFDERFRWRPRVFRTSASGLASGNDINEATLHALYEVVERDVLSGLRQDGNDGRVLIDPATIRDENVSALMEKLTRAGVDSEIVAIPNQYGVPTFAAFIWSPVFPLVCAGSGSHLDPYVALSRAITEAVQTRLTEISATRDDIPSDLDLNADSTPDPEFRPSATGVSVEEAVVGYPGDFDNMDDEVRFVSKSISNIAGCQPVRVDLSTMPEVFSVVRVVCPGLNYGTPHTVHR